MLCASAAPAARDATRRIRVRFIRRGGCIVAADYTEQHRNGQGVSDRCLTIRITFRADSKAAEDTHLSPRKVPLDKLFNSGSLDECLMPYACVDAGSVKPYWGESLPELWGRTRLHVRKRSRSFVC